MQHDDQEDDDGDDGDNNVDALPKPFKAGFCPPCVGSMVLIPLDATSPLTPSVLR